MPIRIMHAVLLTVLRQTLGRAALLFALAPALSSAQALHAGAPAAPGAAIALPDIVARADEEQQFLDRTRQLLASAGPVRRLLGPLDDIGRTVDAKLHITTGVALCDQPVMRLESPARHWEFDARRFQRWELQGKDAITPFNDSAILLAQHRMAWSTTRAAGLLDTLPPSMSAHVDTILGQIDSTEAALGAAYAPCPGPYWSSW